MLRKKKTGDVVTPLQSLEEATTLLRGLSPGVWILWFAGTTPWIAAFVHFWNDMSRAADAPGMLIERSLYVALAYIVMKTAHAVFADRLLAALRGESGWEPPPFRGWLRLVSSQTLIHATMPWVMTLSALAVLPLAWAYAFYQNASVLALSTFRAGHRTRDLVRASLRQSHFRAKHNHWMMIIALPFAFLVWANILVGILTVFSLSKTFTGIDSEFSRNPYAYADTGFLAATVALAYLITGPLMKAIYALRCFQGQSRKNGDDLAVAFRLSTGMKKWPVAAVALFLCIAAPLSAQNPEPTAEMPPAGAAPVELRDSIHDVLERDIYQWRLPRGVDTTAEQSWLSQWIRGLIDWTTDTIRSIIDWLIEDLIRKLFENQEEREIKSGTATPWADVSITVLKVLLCIVVVALVILLVRQWRGLKIARRPARATAAPAAVNLESEAVVASQLPEDEWLRLAEEKAAEGDYRLAMRALFLASLAFLGEKRLVAISRSKSNGDYVRDLSMRARDRAELRDTFRQQVSRFDWAWYGWHNVTPEALNEFRANHHRITAHGS